MVLQKVGEFLTTINVNGEEKISQLQSSDRTFNISEVFNTNILVNGSQKGSFNQDSDSNYDVSVGTDNISLSLNISEDFSSEGRVTAFEESFDAECDWYISNTSDYNVQEGYEIFVNGVEYHAPAEGTVNAGETLHLEVSSTGGNNTVYLDFDLTLKPTVTVNNVSKN